MASNENGRIVVGISGWNYAGWKDDFDAGIPRSAWPAYASRRFTAIEINSTFYGVRRPKTMRGWAAEVPEGFHFSMKGNRYITHSKKLKDADEPVRNERDAAGPLGDCLKTVLWQLPSMVTRDLEKLENFANVLRRRRRSVRHAIEFRDRSWFDDEVAALLDGKEIANTISDAADWPMWRRATGKSVYVRLHGHTRTYASAYSGPKLEEWTGRIRRWAGEGRDVEVYFDNDAEGAAPGDALQLLKLLGEDAVQPAGREVEARRRTAAQKRPGDRTKNRRPSGGGFGESGRFS